MSEPIEESILRALRRLTRSIDLHSRQLASVYGLTGPQLVCLRSLDQLECPTPSALAKAVSLSPSTLTGIVDRLEARQLVTRVRDSKDRRRVLMTITEAGRQLIAQAPSPLQLRFLARLAELSSAEQRKIRDTLDQIVEMMGGEEIEAAPVLSTSPTAQSPEELQDLLDAKTGPTTATEIMPAADSIVPLAGEAPSESAAE